MRLAVHYIQNKLHDYNDHAHTAYRNADIGLFQRRCVWISECASWGLIQAGDPCFGVRKPKLRAQFMPSRQFKDVYKRQDWILYSIINETALYRNINRNLVWQVTLILISMLLIFAVILLVSRTLSRCV